MDYGTRFPLLSLFCTVTLCFMMLHNTINVTGNSLLNYNCVTSIKGAALVKHNYISFPTQNMFACYYHCKEDKRCQSLNFHEKTQLCELNNRTRAVVQLNFLLQQGAFYLDNPFRAMLGSFSELPAVSCQEIKDSSSGLVPSGRYWINLEGSGNQPSTAYCNMERGVIVECTGNPCQNGGTCDYQGEGHYTCRCSPEYSGDHCQSFDACFSKPCLNGGTCNSTGNGFICTCLPLLAGVHCEIGIGVGCDNYSTNYDLDRSVLNKSGSNKKCDTTFVEGWYRFNSTAGTRIPDYCVSKYMCNTHAPGWLNGTHPTPQGGAVNRTACFHWGDECCAWTSAIMVRNCGSFFTYKLTAPGRCSLRYCVTNSTMQH